MQFNMSVSPEILSQIDEIDQFKSFWQHSLRSDDDIIKRIPQVALNEIIKVENNVQCEKFTDKTLEEIFTQLFHKSRPSPELIKQRDLLYRIYQNYETIPLTEQIIKQIHRIIFEDTTDNLNIPGEYKHCRNRIALRHKSGRFVQALLVPPTPEETPQLMTELINWTNDSLAHPTIHPLIVIGIFMNRFLAIHPFTDGNGRIVRLLVILLLLKAGYLYMPYASLEAFINADKYTYYHTLYTANTLLKDDTPFVKFFISMLLWQKRRIETKIAGIKENPIFAVSLSILNLWADDPKLDAAALADILKFDIKLINEAIKLIFAKGYISE